MVSKVIKPFSAPLAKNMAVAGASCWGRTLVSCAVLVLVGRLPNGCAASSTVVLKETLTLHEGRDVEVKITTTDDDVVTNAKTGLLSAIIPVVNSVDGGLAITLRSPFVSTTCRTSTPSLSSGNECKGKGALPIGPDGPMFSDEWHAAGVTAM
jgi:hypothetical protein